MAPSPLDGMQEIMGQTMVRDRPNDAGHAFPACAGSCGGGQGQAQPIGLLKAIKDRMSRTVGAPSETMAKVQVRAAAGRVRSSVLECVEALDQLQATLRAEIERCRQPEMPARKA